MIDVANPKCIEDGCLIRPTYNTDGNTKAIYCKKHKKANMVNIKDKAKCIENNCKKFKTFNYFGEKKALYCNNHKKENMVNIITKKCDEDGCFKIPVYNYKGNTIGIYCNSHKKESMINVKDKLCFINNCNKRAMYYYKTNISSVYCLNHKKDDMINFKQAKCVFNDCYVRPNYNYTLEKRGIYCANHKLDGMIDVQNTKCIEDGCQKQPAYGITKALYCSSNKILGSIFLKSNPPCKTPLCDYQAKYKQYLGYCFRCYVYTYPEKENVKNYKTKECAVAEYPNYTIVTDKKIMDGCSRRRPDVFMDFGDQVIVVEIDENQHDTYDCTCENKRLMEISQDIAHRPLVFIRFNPDEYSNSDGIKVTSCWSRSELKGLPIVPLKRKTEWEHRLKSLKEQIDYWIHNKTDKTLEVVQLFYNMN
jgi:hypothetical protein